MAVLRKRRNDGFDRLLAELLGAVRGPAVEQPARIGYLGRRFRARLEAAFEVMNGKGCHRGPRPCLAPPAARCECEFRATAAHGSSRIGRPARAMYSLACRTVCSPKWKIEAASTAVAWPSRMPATR